MTTPRFRRVAVFVGTAALAAGTGIGVAAQDDESPASPGSSRTAPGLSRQQGPGGVDVSALADELGVSATRLEAAMRTTRPTTPGAGDPDQMIKALADELGLSSDKVRQAFADAFGAPPSNGRTTPPSAGATSQS